MVSNQPVSTQRLRISGSYALRMKVSNFNRREILVRHAQVQKDGVTILPMRLVGALRKQLACARELHRTDFEAGYGAAWLPLPRQQKPVASSTGTVDFPLCRCGILPVS